MNQPFKVRHVREFGDETCLLEAYDLKPGLTAGELIEYVLTRTTQSGQIHPKDPAPGQVAMYERGRLTNTFIIPDQPILRLTLYGGYNRWDYIFEI